MFRDCCQSSGSSGVGFIKIHPRRHNCEQIISLGVCRINLRVESQTYGGGGGGVGRLSLLALIPTCY